MPFLKTVAIILTLAIANPLCCCFALSASDDSASEQQNASSAHDCCAAAQEKDPQDVDHNPDDCLHQYEKESQISHFADSFDGAAKPILYLAELLPLLQITDLEAKAVESCVNDHPLEIRTSPQSVAQTYCVYLL